MATLNAAPTVDVRKVMSGKDGMLYDQEGNAMVAIESYQAQLSVTNATYQPLGSAQERSAMTSFKVTLTFTEVVVEDSTFFRAIMEGLQRSTMPVFNFRGSITSPYDGSTEDVIFYQCVPDGTIDIQNMQPGELYKREWNFIVNEPPELSTLFVNTGEG